MSLAGLVNGVNPESMIHREFRETDNRVEIVWWLRLVRDEASHTSSTMARFIPTRAKLFIRGGHARRRAHALRVRRAR